MELNFGFLKKVLHKWQNKGLRNLPGHYCSKYPSKNPSFFGKNVCQNYSVSAEDNSQSINSQKN